MKRLSLLFVLGMLGCSSPDSKSGSNNGASNNGASNNGASNNGASNNGGPNILDPNDYDRSCEFDYDCEHVYAGDICACGALCPDAINADAVEQFAADRSATMCDEEEPVFCPDAACGPVIAVCSSGTCDSIFARTITAEEFDQSCETAADCVLIPVGTICDACDCGRGAINVSALQYYEEIVADADCNPGPSPCDCVPPQEVDCIEGMCVGGASL